jgi:oligopeptide transport system permease protein
MAHYLFKKISILCLSLFAITTLTFFLMHAIPGDPFTDEQAIPEEIMKAMYRHYGLDEPYYVQYGKYLKGVLTWDLGPSFKYPGRTVNEIIKNGFPVSVILGLEALFISICLGVLMGSLAALKQNRWQDHFFMIFAVIGVSVPSFIMATFLQFIFSMKLELLPVARWGSFAQSLLPAFSLAALPTAFIARLTRVNMMEVLNQDYIQTAKSKGLSPYQILWRHALRNALLPVITYLGPLTANILTGSFIVEKIFAIPGLGQWFVTSVSNRDYTLIVGITLFYSALLIIAVFLVDILYCLIDPRIKIRGKELFDG